MQTVEQLREFASQLGKPTGTQGLEVAKMLHETNFNMTMTTVAALSMADNDQILELGHGNGKHVSAVLKTGSAIEYTGLEVSELMKDEAESQNLLHSKFYLYDGQNIPFKAEIFNKAFTVNTIYFWEHPNRLLQEVYRILRPEGIFAIGFVQRHFMEKLPFTAYHFELYDTKKLENLISHSPFKLLETLDHNERVKTKDGEMVDRPYTVAVLKK